MGRKSGSTKNHQPLIGSSVIAHFLFPEVKLLNSDDEEKCLNKFILFFDIKGSLYYQKKSEEDKEKLRQEIKERLLKRLPELKSFTSSKDFLEKFTDHVSVPINDPWYY